MLRILIVDDHAVVREGLKRIIDDQPGMEVAGEAAGVPEALEQLRSRPIDVAVVDLSLPGRDGMQLLADIRREWPQVGVLILSLYAEEVYAVRALRAGADGYVTKDSGAGQLIAAISMVAQGGKFVTASVAGQLAIAGTGLAQGTHEGLSGREYEVMRLLASGLSVSEIATRLVLSIKTVSTYRTRVLDKMKMQNNAQLMRYSIDKKLVD